MTSTIIDDHSAQSAPDTLVLQPGRVKIAIYLLVCAAFVVSGIWTLQEGFALSWLPITFFSAGALIFLSQLSTRFASLTLREDGFAVRTLFRTDHYRWDEIERFRCDNPSALGSVYFVGGSPSPEGDENRIVLPDNYGLGAERLAAIMNAWKKGARTAR